MDAPAIAFTVAAAALTIAPGADNRLVIRNVLRGGRRDGMVTALGIGAGLCVHATLSACGVSMLLMHSATALHLGKVAGACALAWLGVQSLRRAVYTRPPPDRVEAVEPTHGVAPQQCLLEGVLSHGLNPKAAVFSLAFLPQCIGPTEPVLTQSLLRAGMHDIEGILWFVTFSIMLDHMRRFLRLSLAGWPVWDHAGRVRGTSCPRTPVARRNTGSNVKASTREHLPRN